ncbi:TPA: dihydrofolate reductase [Candidatus Uhrbacteria bacterium]|uniref:Bifunctional deaminase-reductase domain protein n=2 Tax=Candidatus Uhriibacteriota TaxID=1752732 RepID=A0A0G1T5J6_9BACT|nr:MAG: Bifunctional deaminase-reductase domain protein [Candidatus Uhrbacteria bacterium GW2011_GWF2_46_218]KKU40665.1 MAG: Bifunctional deaminase-reductase domain protein [Candidatus Uhrbacteria bacterium GW2011_GWE2_46_68]HBK34348.1 dihydrofolate reductase [Candidatus Uhrbacteria bacterium]HCB19092.1 dihydrofolate reductase [Candidatus Uhrbacteria bacterium]
MKVILLAAISADGKIAQSVDQNSTDWTSKEDIQFFVKKSKEIGALIMGKTTYGTIGKPLKDRVIYVLSLRPEEETPAEGVRYVGGELVDILAQVEADGFSSVLIAGGASVYSQFLSQGLVDEMFLTVEPYLFGKGIPLVGDMDVVKMMFVDAQQIGQETIVLHYRLK